MSQNIAAFNELTGWVFATLYRTHPLGTRLSFSDVPPSISEGICKVYSNQRELTQFWSSTVRWLENEGFITVGSQIMNNADFNGARLTLLGLRTLNSVPESLHREESIGEQLVDELKDTGREIRGAVIAELAGHVLGAFAKSSGLST